MALNPTSPRARFTSTVFTCHVCYLQEQLEVYLDSSSLTVSYMSTVNSNEHHLVKFKRTEAVMQKLYNMTINEQ